MWSSQKDAIFTEHSVGMSVTVYSSLRLSPFESTSGDELASSVGAPSLTSSLGLSTGGGSSPDSSPTLVRPVASLPTRPALVPPDLPDARAPDASSSSAPARDDLDPLDDEAPLDAAAPSSSSPRAEPSLLPRLRDVDDRTWPADGAAGKRTALP